MFLTSFYQNFLMFLENLFGLKMEHSKKPSTSPVQSMLWGMFGFLTVFNLARVTKEANGLLLGQRNPPLRCIYTNQIDEGDRLCLNCYMVSRRYVSLQARAVAQVEPDQGENIRAGPDLVENAGAEQGHIENAGAQPGQGENAGAQRENIAVIQPEHMEIVEVLAEPEHVQNDGAALGQVEPIAHPQPAPNRTRFPVPGFTRAPLNVRLCIFQHCYNQNLSRIHKTVRKTILQEKDFYIPFGARVCEEHKYSPAWNDITEAVRHVYDLFSSRQMSDMLRLLQKKKSFVDFERLSSIPDELFYYYIGFSKAQFNEILDTTPTITRENPNKPRTVLATLLVKLHTGEPNNRLCKIFNMARSTFESKMTIARDALMQDFVPRHLGYGHISREQIISRTLAIPNALFNTEDRDRAITIHDGTYIYLQRSSNYYFQRKSYSLHKWRQLYKPYLSVCSDGHIIDIDGPHDATTSDATILNGMLQRGADPINSFYQANDVFILDRGFRDAVPTLEAAGYVAHMPITSSRGIQLTTEEANQSRKVTMCRWVVETINGRLKNQFKLLRHVANNRALPHLFHEIKIAGSLLNAFGKPLTDHRLVDQMISEIALRSNEPNYLADYIIARNMNALRAPFRTITSENLGVNDFPMLTMDQLIIYALGTYQIKQARSYYGEHIKNNGTFTIEVCREENLRGIEQYNIVTANPWLLRGRIQSRHRQAKVYYTYILIEQSRQGRESINGHYCSCVVGKRTLGCCAHIMSILWYLGWGKYQRNLSPPALFLDNIIIRHDVEHEADETSDEDV